MTDSAIEIVDLGPNEMIEAALFCIYDNRGKLYNGAQLKAAWAKTAYEDGLRIKLLRVNGEKAGFIEYIPIENAWRGVQGQGYIFIHCIWVRGRHKQHGYGSLLLQRCLEDAEGKNGVATVTSKRGWISDKPFFLYHGFEVVDKAPPLFELVAKCFEDAPLPTFRDGWQKRGAQCGSGITVAWANQCPYAESRCQEILEEGHERGMSTLAIRLEHCQDAQTVLSPYGVFDVALNGEFLTYQPLGKGGFARLLDKKV